MYTERAAQFEDVPAVTVDLRGEPLHITHRMQLQLIGQPHRAVHRIRQVDGLDELDRQAGPGGGVRLAFDRGPLLRTGGVGIGGPPLEITLDRVATPASDASA
jgi:hypothetical protein